MPAAQGLPNPFHRPIHIHIKSLPFGQIFLSSTYQSLNLLDKL